MNILSNQPKGMSLVWFPTHCEKKKTVRKLLTDSGAFPHIFRLLDAFHKLKLMEHLKLQQMYLGEKNNVVCVGQFSINSLKSNNKHI